ncbi:MAG: zinc ribbon domain-containing protein [Anaerocolumna sp.]
MDMEYVYKEQFSVIGKLGEGIAENPWNWIKPIWDEANGHFSEIEALAKKNEKVSVSIWGIMSDFNETFARWNDQGGKYLACCEAEPDALPPEGWVKWEVPSQTYLVASCSQAEYATVFNNVIKDHIPNNNHKLVGAVHEHYPEPGNPNTVELYFPIAKGSYFCQSCGMPMNNDEERGTNKDLSKSEDYCHFCYENGTFASGETMEEMIESCVPFVLKGGAYADEKAAREAMISFFPTLKRWKKA